MNNLFIQGFEKTSGVKDVLGALGVIGGLAGTVGLGVLAGEMITGSGRESITEDELLKGYTKSLLGGALGGASMGIVPAALTTALVNKKVGLKVLGSHALAGAGIGAMFGGMEHRIHSLNPKNTQTYEREQEG